MLPSIADLRQLRSRSRAMLRLLAVCGTLLAAGIILPTVSRAGQEEGVWEFNVFGAKAKLDGQGPAIFAPVLRSLDLDSNVDGTLTQETRREFRNSFDLPDDNFLGVRLGYNWTKTLGSEVVYDRNHVGADFSQGFHFRVSYFDPDGDGTLDTPPPDERGVIQGDVGVIITSYQVGVLYHPLGKWKTPWQPYVTLAGGYIDVDFRPSRQLQSSVEGGTDFEREDNGVMVGYGAGLKYYIAENVAIRAEVRGKSYELFDERREDREISLGISFFAPGSD